MTRLAIAVTGAGGFIGSRVLRGLAARGGFVLKALLGPRGAPAAPPPARVDAFRGEIDDPELVARLVAGADVVIHAAGPPSVAASFDTPGEYARVHVTGTATLLDACARAGVSRVVHLSSAEVYGAPERNPVAEDARLQARSPYAAAKIAAERFVESYRLARGLDAVILRPFSVYGPGQSARGLIGELLAQARARTPLAVKDPRPVRDFVFVDDVADAVIAAATREGRGDGAVWNVGSGRGAAVAEVAALIARLTAVPLAEGSRAADRPVNAGIAELVADAGRIRSELGWSATRSLERGIAETLSNELKEDARWGSGY